MEYWLNSVGVRERTTVANTIKHIERLYHLCALKKNEESIIQNSTDVRIAQKNGAMFPWSNKTVSK